TRAHSGRSPRSPPMCERGHGWSVLRTPSQRSAHLGLLMIRRTATPSACSTCAACSLTSRYLPGPRHSTNKSNTMEKSSRHSKITGDFAEVLVLYWLSKYGYECAWVDHTGIDLIAFKGSERMGISVQCRSRYPGTEKRSVSVHKFEKARVPCKL